MTHENVRAMGVLVVGLGLITGAWGGGAWLTAALALPVPGAVTGAALLFASFCLVPACARLCGPAGDLLLKFLPLFLYPLTAGFLALPQVDGASYVKLVVVMAVSLIAAMLVAVWVFHVMRRDDV